MKNLVRWDDEVFAAARDFKSKFGLYPLFMLASSVFYRRIEMTACKDKIVDHEGKKPGKYEYVQIGGFSSKDFKIDFCINENLQDNEFVLIYDPNPDGENEPIPEHDTLIEAECINVAQMVGGVTN